MLYKIFYFDVNISFMNIKEKKKILGLKKETAQKEIAPNSI